LLLVSSWWQHTVRSEVAWKGRAYSTAKRANESSSSK
jgi:hypothetical protein